MPKGLQLAGLVRLVHDAGGTIHVRASEAWHAYRGDPADLLELTRIVLDRIETDLPPGSREANFSLPQALRMRLGDGTEVGLC